MDSQQPLQQLMSLISQGSIYRSYAYLRKLPQDLAIPSRQKLTTELASKIKKAGGLASRVNGLLEQGEYPQALNCLQRAQKLVPDFPNIQQDIDFIKSSLALCEENVTAAQRQARLGATEKTAELLTAIRRIDQYHDSIATIEKQLVRHQRNKRLKRNMALAAGLLLPLLYLGGEALLYMQGNQAWSKASLLVSQGKYDSSQQAMAEARSLFHHVRLTNQQNKENVLLCIQELEESHRFQQGLAGKIKHDGVYLAKDVVSQQAKIKKLKQQAQNFAIDQNYDQARAVYGKALQIALKKPKEHATEVAILQQHVEHYGAKIRQQQRDGFAMKLVAEHELAQQLLANQSWHEAREQYERCLKFAQSHKLDQPEAIGQMQQGIALSQVKPLLVAAEEQDGQQAIELLQLAQVKASALGIADHADMQPAQLQLDRLLAEQAQKQLVRLEKKGDQLSAKKLFAEARSNYLQAEKMAEKSFTLATEKTLARLATKIQASERQQLVASKRQQLLTSYQAILLDNFNLSRNTYFHQPTITLVADKGSHFVFKISALGSPSKALIHRGAKYEVEYTYSLAEESLAFNQRTKVKNS